MVDRPAVRMAEYLCASRRGGAPREQVADHSAGRDDATRRSRPLRREAPPGRTESRSGLPNAPGSAVGLRSRRAGRFASSPAVPPGQRWRPKSGLARTAPADGRETRSTVGNPTRSRLPGATPATAPERGGGGRLAGAGNRVGPLPAEAVSMLGSPLPEPCAGRVSVPVTRSPPRARSAGVPPRAFPARASERARRRPPADRGPRSSSALRIGRGSRALRRAVGSRPVTRTGAGSLRPTRGVPRPGGTGRPGGARRRTPAAARSRGTDRRGGNRSPRSRSRG